jgi:hypothetical protein
MILGLLLIRLIPLPETERSNTLGSGENDVSGTDSPSAIFAQENTSHIHLLADDDEAVSEDVQLIPSSAHSRSRSRVGRLSFSEPGKLPAHGSNNLSGKTMLATFDFWLIFTLTSLRTSIPIPAITSIDERYSRWCRDYVYVLA